jgi:Rrf2 family protein
MGPADGEGVKTVRPWNPHRVGANIGGMLALPKKTDYALIALTYLYERPGVIAPAREIAEAHKLPCALLMNVMKELQQGGMVQSVRGAHGGYQLAADLSQKTLYDIVLLTSGEPALTECCGGTMSTDEAAGAGGGGGGGGGGCTVGRNCPVQKPLRALHGKLVQFLKEVKVAEIVASSVSSPVPMGVGVSGVAVSGVGVGVGVGRVEVAAGS